MNPNAVNLRIYQGRRQGKAEMAHSMDGQRASAQLVSRHPAALEQDNISPLPGKPRGC